MSRSISFIFITSFVISILSGCSVFKNTGKSESPKQDSSPHASKPDGFKPYSEVITPEAESEEGLFTIHKTDDKYYYEIPDSLLDREMLTVSRVSGGVAGVFFGGMKSNTQVLRWEKQDDNILLRRISFNETASDSLPVYKAIQNSNFEPILASFSIEALNEDSTASVINITKLFTSDVPAFGIHPMMRQGFQIRRVDKSRTFIESIRAFPENVEVRHVLTYDAGSPPTNKDSNTLSLELNHSMILLPKEPMQARRPDARVGYFSATQTDYGSGEYRAKPISHITRWKLEPKDPEAYLNGELVEPKKPITFYIDPATPKQLRKWMIQGVNDWQKPFEAAGFKNAIQGKMAPTAEENPDFSLEDIRYPTIRYFASPIKNAFGPHVHDPRSGEIISSSIGWFHNISRLLRNWYFIQTAATNPRARTTQFDDEIMGKLVRFVAAHEVGHALGLPHNMAASHAVPVDSLRSPEYTANHGTATSIMDYARFNYVAQPGDGVEQFSPAMGPYDEWAIKWGYTWFGDMPLEEQEDILHEWVLERADDPIYFYGGAGGSNDPRSQSESLGDNNMEASKLGLANLERITDHLADWTYQKGEDFSEMEELFNEILSQWRRYMGHVTQNVGGIFENHKTYDQEGAVYEPVPASQQQEAMHFLANHAFSNPPEWMLNPDILSKVNRSGVVDGIRAQQASVLNSLMDPFRIARLIEYESRNKDTYSPYEFMDDVTAAIWSEVQENADISVYRRNLQRVWVERMEYLMTEEIQYPGIQVSISQSDIRPMVKEQLRDVLADVKRATRNGSNRATQAHLADMQDRIENILNPD